MFLYHEINVAASICSATAEFQLNLDLMVY